MFVATIVEVMMLMPACDDEEFDYERPMTM